MAGISRTPSSSGVSAARWTDLAGVRRQDYGALAAQAAKAMRWADESIELAASGSSGLNRATFGYWDETVLEHTFDHVEWIGLHTYLNNWKDDAAAFLASADLVDALFERVIAISDAAAAKRRSSKQIMLNFDEWNVWYRTRCPPRGSAASLSAPRRSGWSCRRRPGAWSI